MAQGENNNFLTIPLQEGLFSTVKVERSAEENSISLLGDEDEEETEEDVRLIPRSSPVPRKRGPSIADETAEYMRIRLVLPSRSVSFVDSTGGELVDVRMFVPFDSDEEDDLRWKEEEARYRKTYREPTYRVSPEFQALAETELVLSVHINKLEVESVTSVPDEPLSFEVLIRVLNISFHKSVYVRSTMDGWISHFDYPAEYVQGSNDGETDKFSVKLSFASPYLFNGARIDFVVRYETAGGEFWANNSGRNYSVTLIQSYEDDTEPSTKVENIDLRGILKPPRYRSDIDYDDSYDKEDAHLSSTEYESSEDQTSCAQPIIVQPEIDIETAMNLSSSPQSIRHSSTAGCHPATTDILYGEPIPLSSNNSPQTEESGTTGEAIQQLPLPDPQSYPSQQLSEPQDQVYNVVPSLSPTILVHLNDEKKEYDFEDSLKSKQSSHPHKDDFQSEISSQVPFEFGQPSLAGFSDAPHVQEEGINILKEEKDVEEIQLEIDETETDMLEQPSQKIEDEKTWSLFQMLEEAVQPHSSKTVNNNDATDDVEHLNLTADADSFSEGLQHPLEEGSQEQEVEVLSLVRAETTEAVEVLLTMESTKMGGEEMAGLVASCLSVTNSGPIRQDRETQSQPTYPLTDKSEPQLTTTRHQKEEGLVLEQSELASVLPGDPNYGKQTNTMSTTDHQTTKQEKSGLASVSGMISTTADFTFNLQPSTVHTSTEHNVIYDKSFQGDELSAAPYQTCKDSETPLPLPRESTKICEISKDQTEVTVDKSLIASFTFFIAVVCLAAGIQEPSIFLFVGLFLLSLCF
ncbi:protein phosphatase 1 regulatory subunit 3A [Myxocyprinus asiaticus]|uniref:protein phosphatase 1 regulatory subunit 3A n=1 Tax=Myxocyprinus asiaticus TaxID=70543 RepID=UPI002223DE26|nr:protein phosphatase 1 regulatory subunit 3A [Myxocyprinus asiaticus]